MSAAALYNDVEGKETLPRMILFAVAHAVGFGVAPYESDEVDNPRLRLRGQHDAIEKRGVSVYLDGPGLFPPGMK